MVDILELKVKYGMLRSIANGSFGMVYQMQNKVNKCHEYLDENCKLCSVFMQITREYVAAKRLKHQRPEDVYFSRKEFHILEKVCGGTGSGIVKLLDYFESPSQSVIITEYLEGKLEGELYSIARKVSLLQYPHRGKSWFALRDWCLSLEQIL